MPELNSTSPDNPDFARVLLLRDVREIDCFEFDIAPTPEEGAALAMLVGATAVRKMRFVGLLRPSGRGWQLEAHLGATVVQPCVVSLEPVTTRIEENVRRAWQPMIGQAHEILVSAEDEDEVDPLVDRIDLGRVATEALALAVPAYPRKPGAELRSADAEDDQDRPQPFASLAALRSKLGEGS